MKEKVAVILMFSIFLMNILCVAVPIEPVGANPSGYTYANYVNAITKTADRLIALQSPTDYGWDWDVTGLSSHTAGSSSPNLYGVTAIGLLDAYLKTANPTYLTAAENAANELMIGNISAWGTYAPPYRLGYTAGVWGYSFDYDFLMQLYAVTSNSSYATYASAAWAWQKANIPRFTNAGTLWDYYASSGSYGEAAWMASDWGLAAYGMGDTAFARAMADLVDGNIFNIALPMVEPYLSTNYTNDIVNMGMGEALKFLATVEYPATYTTDMAYLGGNLTSNQLPDGSWNFNSTTIGAGDVQTTAYCVLGLLGAEEGVVARQGADWLVNNQTTLNNGGWPEDPNEYSEIDSEAMQALCNCIVPLTVVSTYGSPSPTSGSYIIGTSITAIVASPVSGTAGTQYVCTGWTGMGSAPAFGSGTTVVFIINEPSTITWDWKIEYYLTVVSAYDTPGGMGWYDDGATAYATLTSGTVDIVPGSLQAVFTSWSGDASGTNYAESDPIVMDGPKTAVAGWVIRVIGNYTTQYYVSVTSSYGSPSPGSGWFNAGSIVTESVSSPLAGPPGTQYVCTGWTGTGSAPPSGSGTTVTFTITESSSVAWDWKTQFYFNVTSSHGSPAPTSGWFDLGSSVNESVESPTSGSAGTQYVCTGWTGSGSVPSTGTASSLLFIINEPSSVAWDWKTQYAITFSQFDMTSGKSITDFDGTIVTVDGSDYNIFDVWPYNTIPFWWDNGSTHSFAFQSPLIIPPGARQYNWASTIGLSTSQSGSINVNGPGTVTGNYVTYVHDVAVTGAISNCTWVYQGWPASVNVTIENSGDFNETVGVTLYYNFTGGGVVSTQSVSLLVGENLTLTFTWNTTGIPRGYNYTMTAVASIPANVNPQNTLVDGNITVRMMFDVNGDGKIDGRDITAVARAFGSYGPNFLYPGSPPSRWWNPDVDFNRDGKIDGRDITMIAKHFGESMTT